MEDRDLIDRLCLSVRGSRLENRQVDGYLIVPSGLVPLSHDRLECFFVQTWEHLPRMIYGMLSMCDGHSASERLGHIAALQSYRQIDALLRPHWDLPEGLLMHR